MIRERTTPSQLSPESRSTGDERRPVGFRASKAKEVTVEKELVHERFLQMIKHLKTCGFAAEMVECKVITRSDMHLHGWGHWEEFAAWPAASLTFSYIG